MRDSLMEVVRRGLRDPAVALRRAGLGVASLFSVGLVLPPTPPAVSALAAALGVAAASLLIALVQSVVRFSNISLVYLLVVLWLGARFGRWPAILGSVLSFLAYDFFFIPPVHGFTVNNPTEWLSLAVLLATSLVIGQMTAVVQARAREAQASEQRTATLYALAELIAASTTVETLLPALARRVLDVFASAGVAGVALILPDDQGRPIASAMAPEEGAVIAPLTLTSTELRAQAAFALQQGRVVGGLVQTERRGDGDPTQPRVCFFVPLRSRQNVIGVLGVVGTSLVRDLASGVVAAPTARSGQGRQGQAGKRAAGNLTFPPAAPAHHALTPLFAAFCRQIALALDRAQLQQEAVHAAALRESDSLKDALLGSVTHDLRTPLASIEAAAESLLAQDITWSEAERHELAETISASAHRLDRLVSNLLDLSRLEAGVAVPELRWYPIGDVMATVLDQLDLIGRTDDYHIAVDVPADVPPVPLDHAQIEQVLTNLIENALKYSPKESTIVVSARVLKSKHDLEVRVADQGIGIPPHELHAIFSKFYRVRNVVLPWTSGRPPAGTGLGLAISAAIIQAHGGHIWAESQPGKGSTFIFTLPIPEGVPESVSAAPAAHTDVPEAEEQKPPAPTAPVSRGATA